MKILKYLIVASLLMVLAISCNKGIDPISSVAPGPDTAAPAVLITYPLDGIPISMPDSIVTVTFKFEASDDIELKKVSLQLDGAEIATFTSFIDYRRAVLTFDYNNLANGNHSLTVVATDMSDKTATLTRDFKKVPPYVPMAGEVFYLPFDGDYTEMINFTSATKVGSPGFATGKVGQAYAGATDSYLQFPAAPLMNGEFSTSFWYKLNPDPLRGGILSISPPGTGNPLVYTRNYGFRLARENNGTKQNIFVNFGIDTTEVWMNPFITVTPSDNWMHIAVSISGTHASIYVDDVLVKETDIIAPIDWKDCTSLSIGSGMPNFAYWEHFSDLSMMDELRFFNKALTADEVHQIYIMK